jgi:hypothetical protein
VFTEKLDTKDDKEELRIESSEIRVPPNFQKMQMVGEGAAATVWIAQNNDNQMIVAIK